MNMTPSQEQAENTSPVTDVMPRRDESYIERSTNENKKKNRKKKKTKPNKKH